MVGGSLQRIVSRLAKQIGQHRVITAAVATFAQREVGLPGAANIGKTVISQLSRLPSFSLAPPALTYDFSTIFISVRPSLPLNTTFSPSHGR